MAAAHWPTTNNRRSRVAAPDVARRPPSTPVTRRSRRHAVTDRRQADQQPGDGRHRDRPGEHAEVETDVLEARDIGGPEHADGARRGQRDGQADDAGASRQGQALRQQRSREPGAAGAQRDADRQLRQPGDAAREREPGDVDRRHQPHQQRRPGEQPDHRARSGTGHLLAERHDADAAWCRQHPLAAASVRARIASSSRCAGSMAAPARSRPITNHEPAPDGGAPRVPVGEQRVRLPHVGGEAGLGHRVRQHADDPRRLAVDQHRRPEDGVRAAEAGAPEPMAQEREPLAFLGVADR